MFLLNLRSTDDNIFYGIDRRIENTSEGITIPSKKDQGVHENFNNLSLYTTICADQFWRWKVQESSIEFSKICTFNFYMRPDWNRSNRLYLELLGNEIKGVYKWKGHTLPNHWVEQGLQKQKLDWWRAQSKRQKHNYSKFCYVR